MAPHPCLLLLLAFPPCLVGAWSAGTSATRSELLRNCQKRGKRHSNPVWMPALREERSSSASGISIAAVAGDDDREAEELWTDGKGKAWVDDGRDSLPFEVYDVVPPKRKIGTAKLPPMTSTGDTMWHGSKHYRVLRVSSHYKYEGGRFVMRKKVIDAKELARVAREQVVARLVYGDDVKPPRENPPR